MAEGRQKDEWGRWSTLLAFTLNGPCERKDKRPWKPDDFNPFSDKSKPEPYVKLSPGEFIDRLTGR